MSTRDAIKNEIDKLPEEALKEVQTFLRQLHAKPAAPKRKRPSFKLKGRFDSVDIRQEAYEYLNFALLIVPPSAPR